MHHRHRQQVLRLSPGGRWVAAVLASRREYNTTYGLSVRSHQGVVSAYLPASLVADESAVASLRCADGAAFIERAVPLLEALETRLAHWRLAKWEFRIPSYVRPQDRESAKRQLSHVRQLILDRLKQREGEQSDLSIISRITGEPTEAFRFESRDWVQRHVADLRWKGDIESARELREAWVRLEQRGGTQNAILERLCYVYSLARLGTFDTAFSNTIVPLSSPKTGTPPTPPPLFSSLKDVPRRGEAAFDTDNPMSEVLRLILMNIPSVALLHDFIGLNHSIVVEGYSSGPGGYRDALGTFLAGGIMEQLHEKGTLSKANKESGDPGSNTEDTVVTREGHRVPRAFAEVANAVPVDRPQSLLRVSGRNKAGQRVTLFDYRVAAGAAPFPPPPCDFAIFRGHEVTLLTIASPNRYIREVQVIPKKQAEGIARRAAMILGTDISAGRCRSVLLPPNYLDCGNLRRIVRFMCIDGDAPEGDITPAPAACRGWVSHYDKKLTEADVDYAAQTKKLNEDEWYRL